MTILLVRHALAVARSKWAGDDDPRPLTARGLRQAAALVDQLATYHIDRIYSSYATRCVDTVLPVARSRRLEIEMTHTLVEGRGTAALPLADSAEHVVLCAHGDNLPELLLALAGHLDDIGGDPPFAKGATWALTRRHGKVVAAEYHEPPA